MADLKRDAVKYIRDKAKSGYNKGSECQICGSVEGLDFHHFNSISEMLHKWLTKKGYSIETAEDIISVRDEFIEDHQSELYDATATLCHTHHLKLHSIYGRNPKLATAPKQARWILKRRDKEYKNGLDK